MLFLSF
jgi:DNA-directed RNA polymerase specialized sigma24 family protein